MIETVEPFWNDLKTTQTVSETIETIFMTTQTTLNTIETILETIEAILGTVETILNNCGGYPSLRGLWDVLNPFKFMT